MKSETDHTRKNRQSLYSTMINSKSKIFFLAAIAVFSIACSGSKKSATGHLYDYTPDNQQLYDTIIYLDKQFFDAYNTCDIHLSRYASFFSDSIEFYHDKGGLMTSKQAIIDATKRNVCGKVARELIEGSIEVYPIHNYGAVEIGLHRFHNNTEKPGTPSNIGKFVIVWQNHNQEWKITRIISLH
jgi:hypothetical protein